MRASRYCVYRIFCFVLFYLRGHLLFTDVLFWGEGENDWLMKIRRNEGPQFKVSREPAAICLIKNDPRSILFPTSKLFDFVTRRHLSHEYSFGSYWSIKNSKL